jgi:hypothetical protein
MKLVRELFSLYSFSYSVYFVDYRKDKIRMDLKAVSVNNF